MVELHEMHRKLLFKKYQLIRTMLFLFLML